MESPVNKDRFEVEALKENAKRLKVLCVENHAGTRLKLARFLREYFEVVFVTTYADNAIKMFENGHFDLIIASATLPDMRTTQLCKKIKNIARNKPIIIVSKNKNASSISWVGVDSDKEGAGNQRDRLYNAYLQKNINQFPNWKIIPGSVVTRLRKITPNN